MRSFFVFAFFFLSFSCFSGSKINAQSIDQLNLVRKQCRQLLVSDTAYATEQSYRLTDDIIYNTDGKGYYKSLTKEGNWKDIDYKSNMRSRWVPGWHLYRLMLVYREYNKNHDAAYLSAIHNALSYWIKNDYICENWWQNQINMPYVYSSLMLMLDKDATAKEIAFLDTVITKRAKQKAPTGQNKIWQHDIEARIALVHNNVSDFSLAMTNMQSVIQMSTGEGIQPDYSFQQHGAMLQFGNYGMHFVNSLLFWMKVTANTPYTFSNERQNIIFGYCSNGLRWTIYKGAMDITAIGRQLRENCAVKRGATVFDDLNLIKSFDKNYGCKYNLDGLKTASESNCTVNGNKSFWRSYYMVQLKSNAYMMSVKMHGPFVKKVESINSENLKGAFLNDGVTLFQHTGKEYKDIEPLWTWNMLPGTTCDTTIDPSSKQAFDSSNQGRFVGQVSDGINGISAMDYDRLGTLAHKSYFYINGAMVALGAGIQSAAIKNVVTNVNQCYSSNKPLIKGDRHNGGKWLWHDNIAYVFPDRNVNLSASTQYKKGNWATIDKASNDVPVADSILNIYLHHKQNDTYAYIVKPAISLKDAKKMSENTNISIIKNTEQVQAIKYDNIIMAVFYQPSEIAIGKNIVKCTQPCMLICNLSVNHNQIYVSDPTRKSLSMVLTVNGKNINVNFPSGNYLGSSVKVL